MEYKLGIDEIFSTFPKDDTDAWSGLEYTISHPFVYARCYRNTCRVEADKCVDDECAKWKCTLCRCHGMTTEVAKWHLHEPTHSKRMAEARVEKEKVRGMVHAWNHIHNSFTRLRAKDAISLPDEVLASCFRLIKTASDRPSGSSLSSLLGKARKLLNKYENMERLSILYLAVWKEECLAQMPAMYTVSSAREWFAAGWKEHKVEQSNSNAMAVVVRMVQPFLHF
jgi:hypothetical protein